MRRADYLPPRQRSPFHALAVVVTILLVAVLGGLMLLGLGETAATTRPRLFKRAGQPVIGLVSGHWQNDSGATCPDGLEEVDVNLRIVRQAAYLLRERGYAVQVLPEFSPSLNGFRGAALLAVHSDSCVQELSGFKAARMTHASDPEAEDRLVRVLTERYAQATGLMPHADTITEDMRQYHALRQIAPETPGAILECGFMGSDRALLTQGYERVAQGIADGLSAFLVEEGGQ